MQIAHQHDSSVDYGNDLAAQYYTAVQAAYIGARPMLSTWFSLSRGSARRLLDLGMPAWVRMQAQTFPRSAVSSATFAATMLEQSLGPARVRSGLLAVASRMSRVAREPVYAEHLQTEDVGSRYGETDQAVVRYIEQIVSDMNRTWLKWVLELEEGSKMYERIGLCEKIVASMKVLGHPVVSERLEGAGCLFLYTLSPAVQLQIEPGSEASS